MPNAFNNTTMNNLALAVRQLFYRRQMVGKFYLTFDEYIRTFVPAEARDAFRQATGWTYADQRQHKWDLLLPNGDKVNATLRLVETISNGEHAPPAPRHIAIQGDAPPEIVENIREWALRGGDPSRDFGRVIQVLNILNQNFSRVAIRYYWPTILAILSEGTNTKDLVQEMQDLKMPARLKPLPPGLMQACRLAAETVSTTRLLPVDVEEPDAGGKAVIDIVCGQHYEETFGKFWGVA
jgi:hypothetical protein